MRLGGPVDGYNSPEEWITLLQAAGYRAAYCPVSAEADSTTIQAYAHAAQAAGIVIAEVGAWSNPLSPDNTVRKAAIEKCQTQLSLADEIGARCCVNIAGSRGEVWDGPHDDNLTAATFDLIVETVRQIIDAVNPRRAFYTLEPMPYMYPDSVDSYLALITAIARPQCAAHFDPVNIINSPQIYYNNGALLEDAFKRLGPYIKSCHAKDITLQSRLTVHLEEAIPGRGHLDYKTFLTLAHQLDPDMPIMLEHLPHADYPEAAAYVRGVAQSLNIL